MASRIPISEENSKTSILQNIVSSLDSFFFQPWYENEVFCENMHLNDKKAIGIENIPIKIIKMVADYISPVLSNLF